MLGTHQMSIIMSTIDDCIVCKQSTFSPCTSLLLHQHNVCDDAKDLVCILKIPMKYIRFNLTKYGKLKAAKSLLCRKKSNPMVLCFYKHF